MKRHFLRFATFALTAMFASSGSADDRKDAYDSESIVSSFSSGQRGKTCFLFHSFMTAESFFKGLRYSTTHSGADSVDEFHKDDRAISTFPDDLQINVFFQTSPCKGNGTQYLSAAELEDLVQSFQLEASWKSGIELRQAELSTPPQLTAPPTPNQFLKNSFVWNYVFHVRARGIPLSHHLVISVVGTNKALFGRMTFDVRTAITAPRLGDGRALHR
jgi:hypothetical protein